LRENGALERAMKQVLGMNGGAFNDNHIQFGKKGAILAVKRDHL
jgi:hypothetical protein